MIDRAAIACFAMAVVTTLFNPWMENVFWRRVSTGLVFAAAFFFVIGGYHP